MPEIITLGEFLTLCFLAIALGMDAFSVSLGLGMRNYRLLHMFKISVTVGLFHIFMPLLGMVLGRYLSDIFGYIAIDLGGIILILFGTHMIYASFLQEKSFSGVGVTGWGLIIFACGVSLDGFSVGLSLGLFAVNAWLAIMLFGLFGFMLTAGGLFMGRKAGKWIGNYSEVIGGVILVAFGLKFLL